MYILILLQWGFLFPLHRTLKIEPLTYQMLDSKKYKTEGQIKVGRASDNDIVITDDQLPKKNINNISRLQFIIERKKDGTVDIQDKSSNGTFIDDLKIGRGNICLILSSIIASLTDLVT